MVALAVYSACVDPDLVLRALRPFARRSALTATLISRMVPLAAADGARLREAAALRGPRRPPAGRGAAGAEASRRRPRPRRGRRRLTRAARLRPRARAAAGRRVRSRHDRRLYLAGAACCVAAALAGKLAGADGFSAYPALEVSSSASTVALSLVVLCCGLVPWRAAPGAVGVRGVAARA